MNEENSSEAKNSPTEAGEGEDMVVQKLVRELKRQIAAALAEAAAAKAQSAADREENAAAIAEAAAATAKSAAAKAETAAWKQVTEAARKQVEAHSPVYDDCKLAPSSESTNSKTDQDSEDTLSSEPRINGYWEDWEEETGSSCKDLVGMEIEFPVSVFTEDEGKKAL